MLIQVELINLGPLSPREADVAKLIIQGYVDKEISRLLGITLKTVQVHIYRIYLKFGINNITSNSRIIASHLMVLSGMFLVSLTSPLMISN